MNQKGSVRFITRKWAPAVGGMETYCLQLTRHIKDAVDLDIRALPGQPNGQAPTTLRLLGFGLTTFLKLLFLPKTDVTHISDMASWPLAVIAKLRRWKTRIVISAHGSDLSFEQRSGGLPKLYKGYMRLGAILLPRAVILANSQWIADLARAKGFKDVRLIPLATDMSARKAPDLPSRDLFYAGRIIRSKGVSFIINEVLPHLSSDVGLRVAGTIWEQAEGEALDHPRVTFLGQLGTEELSEEYAKALCVVVPSLAPEGFGLVAIEGALSGGVVVASDHSGLAEVCADDLGLLAPSGNATAWGKIISDIEGWTQSKRQAFIANAQSQAKTRYNWKRVASETSDAYKSPPI